jgi:hypothetical protein
MRFGSWRLLTPLLALATLLGCRDATDGLAGGNVQITLQAQFEKKPMTTGGPGATVLRPARYCYAEVRDANTQALLSSGYLGSDGTGTAAIPRGLSIYVQVFAQYQVPSPDPASFFLRGSVKDAPLPAGALSLSAFTAIPVWSVTSATVLADRDGTLGVTALASNRIAGAFNIADQAVTFAAAVRDMDMNGTATTSLRLPNLHTFWTTSTNPADQSLTYPAIMAGPSSTILVTDSQRALFAHGVRGRAGSDTDEWDDGVLQEAFAHLLFADNTLKADGSSPWSLLRRDNDNVWVDRAVQSESTVAFVGGFCDFLAGAVRNDSRLLDSYVDGGGVARVDSFDLADHATVAPSEKGEFARGSIAVSLWGIWKNALGGGQPGLNTLWAAARSRTPMANNVGEYEVATLGCYPSYLLGVQSRVQPTPWTATLAELALEAVPNPSPVTGYFTGNRLWETVSLPFSVTDTLQTYDPSANIYYDRNQSQAWRFAHSGTGTRTVTMNPIEGQDFYLEVIGPDGWVAGSFSGTAVTRTLTLTSLPAGNYVARVRAGNTTLTGSFQYTLTIN